MKNFILVAFKRYIISMFIAFLLKKISFFENGNISEQKQIRASDSQNYSIILRYKKLLRSLIYIKIINESCSI